MKNRFQKLANFLRTVLVTLHFTAGIVFCSLSSASYSEPVAKSNQHLIFCSVDRSIDFNPFRPIAGLGFLYYSFTRPIFGDGSLIKKHYFSPDGEIFEAEVSEDATFALSGKPVTAKDVAYSIVGQMGVRLPELQLFPRGTNAAFFKGEWWKAPTIPGVEILSDFRFRITWDYPQGSKNISGRLTEILSRDTPSLKGAFWVGNVNGEVNDFVASYPTQKKGNLLTFSVGGHEVEVRPLEKGCSEADFFDFDPAVVSADPSKYAVSRDSASNPLVAILNSKSLTLSDRSIVASIIRRAAYLVSKTSSKASMYNSHFTPEETGYSEATSWDPGNRVFQNGHLSKKHLTVLILKSSSKKSAYSDFLKELTQELKNVGVIVTFDAQDVPPKFSTQDIGVFIFASANKRQKWLEGALKVLNLEGPIENAPKTLAALNNIRRNASATIPTNEEDLRSFDSAALSEKSIVPIFREQKRVYTKKNSPLSYGFLEKRYPEFKLETHLPKEKVL